MVVYPLANLGWSTVSVIPSAKGFGKALSAQVSGETNKAGVTLGKNITNGLKKGAIVAGLAIGGLVTASLVKGFGRLTAIEDAQAKLIGLGNSAKSVTLIMDEALASVKGTAFGLDEAATTAAVAVAAGVKPGRDLARYLTLIADAASIAGTSMADMGNTLNNARTVGAAYNDTLQIIAQKGIPVYSLLSKELGVSTAKVKDLAKQGEISAKILENALRGAVGGAALEAGNTTSGAFKNMGAALTRFGEGLLKDIFPVAKEVFGWITSWLDDMSAAVTPWAQKVSAAVKSFIDEFKNGTGAAGKFRDILDKVGSIVVNVSKFLWDHKEIILVLVGAFGIYNTTMIVVRAATAAWAAIQMVLNAELLANPIGLIVVAIAAVIAVVVAAYFKFDSFRKIIDATWDGIQVAVAAVVKFFQSYVMPVLKVVFTAISTYVKVVLSVYKAVWNGIYALVEKVVGWFQTNVMPTLSKVGSGIAKVFSAIPGAITGAFKWAVQTSQDLINTAIDGINLLIKAYNAIPWADDVDDIDKFSFALDRQSAATNEVSKGAALAAVSMDGWATKAGRANLASTNATAVNKVTARSLDGVGGAAGGAAKKIEKMSLVWAKLATDASIGLDALDLIIQGKSQTISGKMIGTFQARFDGFKEIVAAQSKVITDARKALDDYASSVSDTIMGKIDFTSSITDAEGKAVPLTPEQVVEMILGDITNQANATTALANSGVMAQLPEALAQKILTMPPDAAVALANYLSANPALVAQLTTNYDALGVTTETLLGIPMAAAFAKVGDTSALSMIASAKSIIKNKSDKFQSWVSRHLDSKIFIDVVYRDTNKPGGGTLKIDGVRAGGGPVWAGGAFLVGEKGPELFMPGSAGQIIPNGSLDNASPATRSAAVAGAGGPTAEQIERLIAAQEANTRMMRDQAERDRTMVRTNGYGR